MKTKVLRICQHGHSPEIYGCFDGQREMACAGCVFEHNCETIVEYKTSFHLNGVPGICPACLIIMHTAYTSPRLNVGSGETNRLKEVPDKNAIQLALEQTK